MSGWKGSPNPGSEDALALGCHCAVMDNNHGKWAPWAVKDIARRLRLYLGFVVAGRGLDERPGRHEPLITEAQYAAAIAGIRRRTRVGRRSRAWRVYVLAGVIVCRCGLRMRGEAHVSRGKEWRYYVCPASCSPSVPAEAAEAAVLGKLAELPPLTRRLIERADHEADSRVTRPVASLAAVQRERLERRLVQLRKQHEWGDITDAEYRAKIADTHFEISRLPDPDKLVAFTANRRLIESLGELIGSAKGPEDHRRLVRAVVERVEARDREVSEILLSPAIADALRLVRPRTALSVGQPERAPGQPDQSGLPRATRLSHPASDRLNRPV